MFRSKDDLRPSPNSKAMYRISRNKQLRLALKNCVVSVVTENWWSDYYSIKTIDGLKLFSFVWSSKTGWNVFKRDFSNLTPSLFLGNGLWSLKQVVAFVKNITVKSYSS